MLRWPAFIPQPVSIAAFSVPVLCSSLASFAVALAPFLCFAPLWLLLLSPLLRSCALLLSGFFCCRPCSVLSCSIVVHRFVSPISCAPKCNLKHVFCVGRSSFPVKATWRSSLQRWGEPTLGVSCFCEVHSRADPSILMPFLIIRPFISTLLCSTCLSEVRSRQRRFPSRFRGQ